MKRHPNSEGFDAVFGGLFTLRLKCWLALITNNRPPVPGGPRLAHYGHLGHLRSGAYNRAVLWVLQRIRFGGSIICISYLSDQLILHRFLFSMAIGERPRQSRRRRQLSPSHYLKNMENPIKLIPKSRAPETEAKLSRTAKSWERYAQATFFHADDDADPDFEKLPGLYQDSRRQMDLPWILRSTNFRTVSHMASRLWKIQEAVLPHN